LTGSATLSALYQSKPLGESKRVLHCGSTCPGECGDGVDWQNADSRFLDGAGDYGQGGGFPRREAGGDLGRDDP
jgi:hypothetical protein